jgi:hypothetical protein
MASSSKESLINTMSPVDNNSIYQDYLNNISDAKFNINHDILASNLNPLNNKKKSSKLEYK